MLNKIILVFLGGGIGAAARELLMLSVPAMACGLPLAIFAANMAAAFLIGLLTGFSERDEPLISSDVNVFTITGIMGGLSSFCALIYSSISLSFEPGMLLPVFLYLCVNMSLGFLLAALGLRLGRGGKKPSQPPSPSP